MKSLRVALLLAAALVPVALAATAPVEFTFVGLSQTRDRVQYQVEIRTDRPVREVDVRLEFFNSQGRSIADAIQAWPGSGAGSPARPEPGHTYTVTESAPPGAVRAQGVLLRVIFTDGTGWTPPHLAW